MGLPLRDHERHTYADYLAWPEDARYELIEGVAYAMAPPPAPRHQSVIVELVRQVANALEGTPCRAFVAPVDVRLPRHNETDQRVDTVVQPDLFVVCDPLKIDERGIRGAPDWVVEVLSPATAGHDQILKRALYERVGVREYWLVHPTDLVLTIYRMENGRYAYPDVRELKETTPVAVLPEVLIDWDRMVAALGG